MVGSTIWTPLMTSLSVTVAMVWCVLLGRGLLEVDERMVAEHEPDGAGPRTRPVDLDVPPDQRILDAGHADDAGVLEHDRVLDLAVDENAVVGHRGERPDVGVLEAGV